jgi:hypothetical protein
MWVTISAEVYKREIISIADRNMYIHTAIGNHAGR